MRNNKGIRVLMICVYLAWYDWMHGEKHDDKKANIGPYLRNRHLKVQYRCGRANGG